MPSLGQPVLAGDFTPESHLDDNTDILAFTTTSYAQGSPVVGCTFTVPTSGKVIVFFKGRLENNSANQRATLSIEVATGGTIGSGSVVSGGDDDSCIETSQGTSGGAETRTQCASYRIVPGLTPGNTYNAYCVHKTFGGNADIFSRGIAVIPAF